MNRSEYIEERKKQVSESNNLQKQNTKLRNEIMNLNANNYVSDEEYKFLSKLFHSSPAPVFYGLPKIHKFFEACPPLRPIVSGFNCISGSPSEYVYSFLKYKAKTCKSYIRDALDFLLKLKSLFNIRSTSILVTIDVNSLYTNIHDEEGADSCFKKL